MCDNDSLLSLYLVPGGGVSMDGESPKTNTCIFSASEDMDTMRTFEQVMVLNM